MQPKWSCASYQARLRDRGLTYGVLFDRPWIGGKRWSDAAMPRTIPSLSARPRSDDMTLHSLVS
jgi:hypothetical protein